MLSFDQLPCEVLSSVLGSFCDGITISTFMNFGLSCQRLKKNNLVVLSLCRDALVRRYTELRNHNNNNSNSTHHNANHHNNNMNHDDDDENDDENELHDVLDVIREDIRTSTNDDPSIITKISEWCAILDYLEIHIEEFERRKQKQQQQQRQLEQQRQLDDDEEYNGTEEEEEVDYRSSSNTNQLVRQFIIWSGRIEVPYGPITGYIITPHFTIGAIQYWKMMEESNTLSFTTSRERRHLRPNRFGQFYQRWYEQTEYPQPYGILFAMTTTTTTTLRQQGRDHAHHHHHDEEEDDDDEDEDEEETVPPSDSQRRLSHQAADLRVSGNHPLLLPLNQSYDDDGPTIILTDFMFVMEDFMFLSTTAPGESIEYPRLLGSANNNEDVLLCCWDKELGESDVEEAIRCLGKHVIQIMKSFDVDDDYDIPSAVGEGGGSDDETEEATRSSRSRRSRQRYPSSFRQCLMQHLNCEQG